MNGRTQLFLGCVLTLLVGGCDEAPSADKPKPDPTPLAEAFDPETTGTIIGRVVWQGELPRVAPYRAPINPCGIAAIGPLVERPNPNAPVIDKDRRGIAGAVVRLRGVDPKRSRPWDLPPVRVEMRDYDYRVCQGESQSRTGFVRRGTAVEFVSRQAVFHSLRARGDAFFTLAFPDAEQPRERVLERPGIVELSSAAGYFWARGYLFVDEHPYQARTDAEGRFTLSQVPPGEYELVCWLPNWGEKDRELDADSWQVSRLTFHATIEEKRKVSVTPRATTNAGFTLSAPR